MASLGPQVDSVLRPFQLWNTPEAPQQVMVYLHLKGAEFNKYFSGHAFSLYCSIFHSSLPVWIFFL
jgi:hypothetical protein